MAIAIDQHCGFDRQDEQYYARHSFFGHQLIRSASYAFFTTYRGRTITWRSRISQAELERLHRQQSGLPVRLISAGKRTWWWFHEDFYAITEPFDDPQVIKGLILQWQQRRVRKAERAQATAAGKTQPQQRAARQPSSAAPSPTAPWQILNVDRSASAEEVKKAYLRQVALYHPDKVAHLGPDLQKLAEEKTRQINQAYEALRARA